MPLRVEKGIPIPVRMTPMKKFVVVLTDEAVAAPERFVPQLEEALAARGVRNFQFLPTVGVINVDTDLENPDFGHLPGVLAVEPDTSAEALADHPLAVKDEQGNVVGTFGKW